MCLVLPFIILLKETKHKHKECLLELSTYQKNILAKAETNKGNFLIDAKAGSGKTFMLLEIMNVIKGKTLSVAFSQSIQKELSNKVPSFVDCRTIHSLGFEAIRKSNRGYTTVDNRKINWIMDKLPALSFNKEMEPFDKFKLFEQRSLIKKMVSICKSTLTQYDNMKDVIATCDQYNIEFIPEYYELFKSVFVKSLKLKQHSYQRKNLIDYDDMIYLPVFHNWVFPSYDNVLIDETQDLNKCQIELILRCVKSGNGRVIAVGDPQQSIYGFRGADTKAMENVQSSLKAKVLPLSVCYRCPTSHIELAQEIVPEIEASPNAIEGTIQNINWDELADNVKTGDLCLCRVNAKLISGALKCIANGQKAIIKGKDIGENLISIVNGLSCNYNELEEKLESWANQQYEKLTKRRAPKSTLDTIADKVECIKIVADSIANISNVSIESLTDKIESLFSDNHSGVVFSSVHRAKGLEADNVFILNPELLPLLHKNQSEDEQQQEMNIKYVALTRSKKNLTFVNERD